MAGAAMAAENRRKNEKVGRTV